MKTLIHIYKTALLCALALLFLSLDGVSAQSVTITGDDTLEVDEQSTYSIGSTSSTISWSIIGTGGQILSGQGTTNVTVKATTGANFTIQVQLDGGSGGIDGMYIKVTPLVPDTPGVTIADCDVTLTRGTPPTGVTWFWQGTNSNGTDQSDSAATYDPPGNGLYYLRARSNGTDGVWSISSTGKTVTMPSTPATPSLTGNSTVEICSGQTTTFTISSPLSGATYKWYEGATELHQGTSFSTSPTTSTSYTVEVTSAEGCTSMAKSLQVDVISLAAPLANNGQNDCTTTDVVVSVNNSKTVNGTVRNDMVHVWYSDAALTTVVSHEVVSGTPSGTLATEVTVTNQTDTTFWVVTELGGCTGPAVQVTADYVDHTFTAGGINGAQTICYNSIPTLLGQVYGPNGGDGNFTYQWEASDNETFGWASISGATSISYQPSSLTTTKWYRRVDASCSLNDTTDPVQVVVNPPLGAGTISGIPNVCHGGAAPALNNATLPTGGDGTYAYQWEVSPNGTGSWSQISGATSDSYTPGANQTLTQWYRRKAISCAANQYSNIIEVTVEPQLVAGNINGQQSICYNETPGILGNTASASGGDGTLVYQWQSSTDGSNWSNISGATSETYDPSSGIVQDTWYQRTVTSCATTLTSNSVQVTVAPELDAPTGTDTVSICGTGTVAIALTKDSDADKIRWYTTASGGTYFYEGDTYNAPATSTTYYAASYSSTALCESPLRKAVGVVATSAITWYNDTDGDGFGDPNDSLTQCEQPLGYVQDNTDQCPTLFSATDGSAPIWYADTDGDTYGDPNSSQQNCTQPTNYVSNSNDCDDNDATINPDTIWYLDADDDGHAVSTITSCTNPGTGYTQTVYPIDDCNDSAFSTSNDCSGSSGGGDYASPMAYDYDGDNYIYTRTYQEKRSAATDFFTEDSDLIQQITYFDGLGRAVQQIGIDQSPTTSGSNDDIITYMDYDAYGRMPKEFLPYATAIGTLGDYRSDGLSITNTFYSNKYNTTNPSSEKAFEPSPLNRTERQAAPGDDWKLNTAGDDHSIEFDYLVNTTADEVIQYHVTLSLANNTHTPTLGVNGTYAEGDLYKTITRDENHSGSTKDHTTEEFKNKSGQVLLKRTYADIDLNSDGDTDDTDEMAEAPHDTYYVYDDYGNLTYVLPPKMEASTATLTELDTNMDALGYQYVYDHRNRLVEKKIPGKGKEYIVYNKLDQPILTQDANQRDTGVDPHEWLFTKYDAFGRVAYTGKATDDRDRDVIQTEVDAVTDLWVNQSGTNATFGGTTFHYNDGAYPSNANSTTTVLTEVLTINYYDTYVDEPTGAPGSVTLLSSSPNENNTINVKGLVTGSRVKVLDDSASAGQEWINTITYYDDKARPVYTYSKNNYLGTTDIVETQLDFVGNPIKSKATHIRNGNTLVTIDNFTYDQIGRLLAQTQCIGDETLGDSCTGGSSVVTDLTISSGTVNDDQVAGQSITISPDVTLLPDAHLYIDTNGSSGTEELIVLNEYDELGQLLNKKVGGASHATDVLQSNGLQQVDYTYNIRGWLKTINEGTTLGTDLFGFQINYNDPTENLGATALFNGNISETLWETANDDTKRAYGYTYDALNRITDGKYNLNTNYDLADITYDKMGNILGLKRQGHTVLDGNGLVTTYGDMDILDYDYDSGNKLTQVNDTGNSTYGFKDSAVDDQDYWYDDNGNMTKDDNKNITSITYNHLNLPTNIVIGGTGPGTITYIYDATGVKQKKTVSTEGTTEYAGNYIYENNILQFFNHAEGYVTPDGSGGYDYVYNYTDHLGNVRLSYTDANDDGTITVSSDPNITEIVEENNYYPFGLKHKGYNGGVSSLGNSVAKNWKYNGKEFNEDLGLDWYDYGTRMYDPTLARFMVVDIASEIMKQYSPYVYSFNSPVMFEDKDGNFPTLAVVDPTDPPKGLTSGAKVDMAGAPSGSPKTAKGFPRNSRWFWKQMVKKNPKMFSDKNIALIKAGQSPVVDPKWVEFNPSHGSYKGKLVHHHVDQGRFAVGIPEGAHKKYFAKIHSRFGSKAKGFFKSTMKFANTFVVGLSLLDMFSDNPDSMGSLFSQSSGNLKEGNIYKNTDGGYYSISNREYQKNGDGEIESVTATVTLYKDYTYNEETGKYEGVGKYDEATVKQYKGKKAQEYFRTLQENY